jgi:hypothetical protein
MQLSPKNIQAKLQHALSSLWGNTISNIIAAIVVYYLPLSVLAVGLGIAFQYLKVFLQLELQLYQILLGLLCSGILAYVFLIRKVKPITLLPKNASPIEQEPPPQSAKKETQRKCYVLRNGVNWRVTWIFGKDIYLRPFCVVHEKVELVVMKHIRGDTRSYWSFECPVDDAWVFQTHDIDHERACVKNLGMAQMRK